MEAIRVDNDRMRELEAKRDLVGLSDAEAMELGRLYATLAGKPYGNHETLMAAEKAEEEEGGEPERSHPRARWLRRRAVA